MSGMEDFFKTLNNLQMCRISQEHKCLMCVTVETKKLKNFETRVENLPLRAENPNDWTILF